MLLAWVWTRFFVKVVLGGKQGKKRKEEERKKPKLKEGEAQGTPYLESWIDLGGTSSLKRTLKCSYISRFFTH